MALNAELEAIKDAWDKETGDGREEERTRALCDAYVEAHPEFFVTLAEKTLVELVDAVSVFRAAGMETEQWHCEVWLLHKYEPQNIGGPVQVRVRRPGRGE
jgi:hypothetical protein